MTLIETPLRAWSGWLCSAEGRSASRRGARLC